MKNLVIISLLMLLIPTISFSQYNIDWDEAYGGIKNEAANKLIPTKDGGYLVVGYTESQGSGKKDGWLIKVSKTGEQLWDVTYGGEKDDELFEVMEWGIGEFLLAGYTESKGAGDKDFWLIMVDKEGRQTWDTTYGGKDENIAKSMIKTQDGNLLICGESKSYSAGAKDIWLVNVDMKSQGKGFGKLLWKKNLGGTENDFPGMIRWNPNDSLYYIIASSASFSNGGNDAWFISVQQDKGAFKMKRNYGYKNYEYGHDFQFTSDSYAVFAGSTLTKGAGLMDGWIVKLADGFDEEYEKFYGGMKEDEFRNVFKTPKGYLAVGNTMSIGEGRYDMWLLGLDNKLEKVWEGNIGEQKDDKMMYSIMDADGNLIFCGSTYSKGNGAQDLWIGKVIIKE